MATDKKEQERKKGQERKTEEQGQTKIKTNRKKKNTKVWARTTQQEDIKKLSQDSKNPVSYHFSRLLGSTCSAAWESGKIFLMNQEVKLKTFGGTRPFKGQERYTERRGPHDLTVLATSGWMYQG